MLISTKGRYALRVMLDLAERQEEGYISLKDIAQRQAISLKYLEMVVGILARGGFVISQRGKCGGYCLARAAAQYTIGEILRLTEGTLAPVHCLSTPTNSCKRTDVCQTLPLWQGLHQVVEQYLNRITLQDVIDGKIPMTTLSAPQ